MQTFLSEPTFEASARALDSKRLNKQLLEGRQILAALAGETKGWVNHPATKMWEGYEWALMVYLRAVRDECRERGIKCENNWEAIGGIWLDNDKFLESEKKRELPPWWAEGSDEKNRIMFSHKANLYVKDPEHYSQYAKVAGRFAESLALDPMSVVCCPDRRKGEPCGYYWPTHVRN